MAGLDDDVTELILVKALVTALRHTKGRQIS